LHGIRAGYLVDAFHFTEHSSEQWFRALLTRSPEFAAEIAIVHESSSDSVFILNRRLLQENVEGSSLPIWVWVNTSTTLPSINPDTPPSIHALIHYLSALLRLESTAVHRLTLHNPSELVPLAAFLLEYPVGYILPQNLDNPPGPLLPNIPLAVFRCILIPDLPVPRLSSSSHLLIAPSVLLISFSCPASLTTPHLAHQIKRRFQPRLERRPAYGSLNIETYVRTFDRVVL